MSNKKKSDPDILPVSFAKTLNDRLLRDWLNGEIEEFGSASGYVKCVLRQEMKRKLEGQM